MTYDALSNPPVPEWNDLTNEEREEAEHHQKRGAFQITMPWQIRVMLRDRRSRQTGW